VMRILHAGGRVDAVEGESNCVRTVQPVSDPGASTTTCSRTAAALEVVSMISRG
jgi:hypothetical protein